MLLATSQKWFADEEQPSLSWLREACQSHRQNIIDALAPLHLPELQTLELEPEPTAEEFWKELIAALSGEEGAIASRLSAFGARAACSGADLRELSDLLESSRRRVTHVVIDCFGHAPRKLEGALFAMQRLFDRVLHAITREYLLYREALLEEQRRREDREHRRTVELEAENQRIQAASRLKSEFLANMSHELRTPLNSIIGFADLLFDHEVAPDTPEHREFLGDILKSARHLLKLINDVLDLAKVEAGKMEFRPEDVDLSVLIHEVLDALRSQAIAREIALRCEVSSAVMSVVVDPARLRQVLYNYLSNALKFTPPGGRVGIRAFADAPGVFRIEVQDNGIGIHEQDIDRLFLEFEQVPLRDGRPRTGTGLGLALTKRIVEAQGGEVGVYSVLDHGSTFWVSLPSDDQEQRAPRAASYFEELRPSSAKSVRRGA